MQFQAYQVVAGGASLVAATIVVELIRRRKIQDTLWLPWLGAALFPAVLGAWIEPWAAFARWLGIIYEPLLLVAVASLISFGILLHLSVVVSTLIRNNLRLAQELALLRHEVERLSSKPGSLVSNDSREVRVVREI